jgi:hypothetical protein
VEEVRAAGADGGRGQPANPRTRELVDEIVRLSIRHGILTEYTAFLALEPEDRDRGVQAEAPAALAPAAAYERLERSREMRVGESAVYHQQALDQGRLSSNKAGMNIQWTEGGGQRARQGVQHIGDRSLFLRGSRWVDGRLYMQEAEPPEVVIEFGTPEYERLVERLTKDNLQALIANAGETYLLLDGQRVLVKGPGAEK